MSNNNAEGQRRKQHAFRILLARREALIRRARRAFVAVLIERGTATADDVRAVVPLPLGIDPVVFGAVPGELCDDGIIKQDGFVKSIRPEAHARPIQRWMLVDRLAAFSWLAAHPEVSDPVTCGDAMSPTDGVEMPPAHPQGNLFEQIGGAR